MKLAIAIFVSSLFLMAAAPDYDIGPPIGVHIPAFSARDSSDAPRKLANIMGSKGVVLVFFRSARWCPYCQAQLISLRDLTAPLAERGYKLAAISYDSPAVLATFTQKRDINYTLLSDAGSRMIDAFKLRDPQYKADSFAYGVPQPAIFVIAPNGVIRAKLAEQGFKVRPNNAAILVAVDSLTR